MSYGVNKKWASQRTRARRAARARGRTTKTAKRSRRISARRARKSSTRSPSRKKQKPTRGAKRSSRQKKARTYVRYDPITGQKVKVTADDPRFEEWSNRKPSRRSKLAKKIRERPGEYIAERASRVLESRARTATRSLGRVIAASAPAALSLGAAAASAAILAAGYVVMDRVARTRGVALGERANEISRKFTATQAAIMRAFNAGSWSQVPQDVRDKATNDYKRALATLYAQAQGSALIGQREVGSYK